MEGLGFIRGGVSGHRAVRISRLYGFRGSTLEDYLFGTSENTHIVR